MTSRDERPEQRGMRCEPASLHASLLLTLSSISQFETNTKRITGVHRLAIFGRGSIMPRASLCKPQSSVVEPRTSGRFDERRLGNEAPPTVDAYADRRQNERDRTAAEERKIFPGMADELPMPRGRAGRGDRCHGMFMRDDIRRPATAEGETKTRHRSALYLEVCQPLLFEPFRQRVRHASRCAMDQTMRDPINPIPCSLGSHRLSWRRRLHQLMQEHLDRNSRRFRSPAAIRLASADKTDAAADPHSMDLRTPID
jgi:hypothetical protein